MARQLEDDEFDAQSGKKGSEKLDSLEIEKLDNFFSTLAGDYEVTVYRDEPKEYKGFLETFAIDDMDTPVSIRYLIETWGGKVLRLMVRSPQGKYIRRAVVPLRSYEPLVRGIPCDQAKLRQNPGGNVRDGSKDYLEMLKTVQATIKDLSPPHKDSGDNGVAAMMLQLMVPFVTAIANNMTKPPTGQPSMMEMLTMMTKMKDFVSEGGSGGNSEEGMMAGVLRIGEALVSKQNAPPPQMPNRLMPARVTSIPPDPVPPPVPIRNPEPDMSGFEEEIPVTDVQGLPADGKVSIDAIPEMIAQLPPELTTQLFMEILNQMTENKRDALLSGIFAAVGVEEYDEPDDHAPTGPSVDIRAQGAGQPTGRPNAGNRPGGGQGNKAGR